MTLKSFIEKNPNTFASGFVAPDRDFFPCDYMEHWDMARKICSWYKYDDSMRDPETIIEEKGWIHITRSTLMGCLMIMGERRWTEAQIEAIRPLVENPPCALSPVADLEYGQYYPDIDIKSREKRLSRERN